MQLSVANSLVSYAYSFDFLSSNPIVLQLSFFLVELMIRCCFMLFVFPSWSNLDGNPAAMLDRAGPSK
jgi:hypothetical protein